MTCRAHDVETVQETDMSISLQGQSRECRRDQSKDARLVSAWCAGFFVRDLSCIWNFRPPK